MLVATTNVARNSSRAIRRHKKLLESLPRSNDVPDAAEEFLVDNPQEALDKELAEALHSLNHTDRHLVSLVVFEEYTITSAARLLHLTPEAAKSRLFRARQRMKLTFEHP